LTKAWQFVVVVRKILKKLIITNNGIIAKARRDKEGKKEGAKNE